MILAALVGLAWDRRGTRAQPIRRPQRQNPVCQKRHDRYVTLDFHQRAARDQARAQNAEIRDVREYCRCPRAQRHQQDRPARVRHGEAQEQHNPQDKALQICSLPDPTRWLPGRYFDLTV